MISYKKINLLDIRLSKEFNITNKDELIEIKSPIIMYSLNSKLTLHINKYSESHNLFYNICGYVDRLFKIREIQTDYVKSDNIILTINNLSKIYDENSKLINISTIKKEGKIICSFTCSSGEFFIKNLLIVK
jgi:hypothetical protein|tara:strand:+ start:1439 stop:1834 length:396 start_codon:yes stop_codon:yes gene_type:complete